MHAHSIGEYVAMDGPDFTLIVGPFLTKEIAETWGRNTENANWEFGGRVFITNPEVAMRIIGG